MRELVFRRWVLQTATRWADVEPVVVYMEPQWRHQEHGQFVREVLTLSTELLSGDLPISTMRDVVLDGLKRLEQMAASHFEREHEYIEQQRLADGARQRHEHAAFQRFLVMLRERFYTGDADFTVETRFALLDEWVNHINFTDTLGTPALEYAQEVAIDAR